MIRTNPKYSNICWNRVGSYRNNACVECKKKEECDSLFSNVTGRFSFEKPIDIRKPSTKPRRPKIKIRNRLIPVAAWLLNSEKIKNHVDALIENGAVYSDDLMKASGLHREIITTWLKKNGFIKRSKHSKRWENNEYKKV